MFGLHQSFKTVFVERVHPGLDGPERVAKILGDLLAAVTSGNQKYSVQAMIISGVLVPVDLVLQTHYDQWRIWNGQILQSTLTD
jgi:hypothetical protein